MRGVAVQVAVLLGVAVDVAVGFEDCPPWTSLSSEAAFPLSRLGGAGADLGAARGGVAATVEKERGRESGTEGTSVVGTGRFWHLHGLVGQAERSDYQLQNIYSMLETTEKTGKKKHDKNERED